MLNAPITWHIFGARTPGSLLVEAACSTDRVHEALSTLLPLVPGMGYYR